MAANAALAAAATRLELLLRLLLLAGTSTMAASAAAAAGAQAAGWSAAGSAKALDRPRLPISQLLALMLLRLIAAYLAAKALDSGGTPTSTAGLDYGENWRDERREHIPDASSSSLDSLRWALSRTRPTIKRNAAAVARCENLTQL